MSEPSTALAVPEQPALPAQVPSKIGQFIAGTPQHIHWLDPSSEDGAKLYLKALTSAERTFSEFIGQTLRVVNMLAKQVAMEDQATGELVELVRTVLILDDGECVATTSPYVRQTLGAIMTTTIGEPPWAPPLLLRVYSPKGSRAHQVEYCGRAPVDPDRKRSK